MDVPFLIIMVNNIIMRNGQMDQTEDHRVQHPISHSLGKPHRQCHLSSISSFPSNSHSTALRDLSSMNVSNPLLKQFKPKAITTFCGSEFHRLFIY